MEYLLPPAPVPSLPVLGSASRLPVRRIFCVGRNYAEHAREMGHDPEREAPFFFTKPADALVADGGAVAYPPATARLEHEVELVVAIGVGGADIAVAEALDHVIGYAVGLDLTRRDLQAEAKQAGRPWDMGKGFDQSAPCSALALASEVGHPRGGPICLEVNDDERQRGDLGDQIWSVAEVISQLSKLVRLMPGDLIYTGTPAGVGPLVPGDRLHARIAGVGELLVEIA